MVEALSILGLCLAVLIPCALLIRLLYAQQRSTRLSDPTTECPKAWHSTESPGSRLRKQVQSLNQRKLSTVTWPAAVVQLAKAYTACDDCGFALHDALLEAGRPDEAEAFRGPNPSLQSQVLKQILGDSDE